METYLLRFPQLDLLSSRPAWSTEQVLGQQGLPRETLSQKRKKKEKRGGGMTSLYKTSQHSREAEAAECVNSDSQVQNLILRSDMGLSNLGGVEPLKGLL